MSLGQDQAREPATIPLSPHPGGPRRRLKVTTSAHPACVALEVDWERGWTVATGLLAGVPESLWISP